jgi:hypothetical protein
MRPRRQPLTLADYLVVAICPTLIGLLVGSLMWFLVEVFYQGDGKFVMFWVLSFFVLGIVSIARLSMEQGWGKASLAVLPLAGAVGLLTPPVIWPLLALVWWAAHKLTWDSTLIDDSQDTSGQGLLNQMGLESSDQQQGGCGSAQPNHGSAAKFEATTTAPDEPPSPWWYQFLEADKRPHAPGVWVIYFSLAALPLFGVGGWFVTDPVARARVFGLLVIYVASGMGLLLATSFLGLRRYLRQRQLQMPMEMTSTWIVVGVVMICAMLLVAAILPRPRPEQSLTQVPVSITSAARKATKIAFGKRGIQDDKSEDPATAAAREGQKTERKGKEPGGENGDPAPAKGEKGQGGEGKGKSDGGGKSKGGKDAKGGEQKGEQAAKGGEEQSKGGEQKEPLNATESKESSSQKWSPQETLSQVSSAIQQSIGPLFRWIAIVALVLAGLGAAWVYREELWAAWLKLLAELRELWESWFGGKKQIRHTEEELASPAPPPRMFASFADPFLTGDAARMPWPQLVRYTFSALEAWAREHDCPRDADQTPLEFGQALATAEPAIAADVQALIVSYSQLAYAPRGAANGQAESLRQLWFNLRSLGERAPAH